MSRAEQTERARVFLAASVGEISVVEAAKQLRMSRKRFYEIEERAMTAYIEALELRPSGRPPKEVDPGAPFRREIEALKKENERLKLHVATLRQLAGIVGDEKKRADASSEGTSPGKPEK